jgi:tellurite resistance protein TehA-like permease
VIITTKEKLINAPTPMAGLALGIGSLGWCWESFTDLNGMGQIIGAIIAGCLLSILALKFIFHNQLIREDLAHPVVGSVVPTFAMGCMVVSNCIGQFFPLAGDGIWLIAVLLHVVFLICFIYHRAKAFELDHMLPSWFVPPVGIIVADVSFSGNPVLAIIAGACLWFGMVSYAIMLPLMIYRFMFASEIPDAAKPTMAIMAAPASLSLAGYLSITEAPSPVIISLLFGIAILMTVVIYLAFFKLLKLPFSPGYAAFTFPMVIGSTALYKTASWMASHHLTEQYAEQVSTIASFELLVATLVVSYVAYQYVIHIIVKPN